MLTQYDEYPVHQTVQPFSEPVSTDYTWNDGYYFDFYDPVREIDVFMSLRVHPNTNMINAFVGVVKDGHQRTLRLSRVWRPDCDTSIGPFRISFPEPFRRIRLTLAENPAGFSFDVDWCALAAPVEEHPRLFKLNGRKVTEQVRYLQSGAPSGWVEIDGSRYECDTDTWGALRDHSWGLYFEQDPLKPDPKWLPEQVRTRAFEPDAHLPTERLAFYTWNFFNTADHTGVYWSFDNEEGGQPDVFASSQAMKPGGYISRRGDFEKRLRIVDIKHELTFLPGTRVFSGGVVRVVDEDGGEWTHEMEVGSPPWILYPGGVFPGTWKDGGAWNTYHGEGVSMEWDDIDISRQPLDYTASSGVVIPDCMGMEYNTRLKVTDPSGKTQSGIGHSELMSQGRYIPYGFEDKGAITLPDSHSHRAE